MLRKRLVFPLWLPTGGGLTMCSWIRHQVRNVGPQMADGCGEAADCKSDVGARRECGIGGACARAEREPGIQVARAFERGELVDPQRRRQRCFRSRLLLQLRRRFRILPHSDSLQRPDLSTSSFQAGR